MFKEQAPTVFLRRGSEKNVGDGGHRALDTARNSRPGALRRTKARGPKGTDNRWMYRFPRAGLGSLCLVLILSFELCSWNSTTQAAGPTLDHLYPVAVQIGSTNAVTAIGKFDPWPPKVWVDA